MLFVIIISNRHLGKLSLNLTSLVICSGLEKTGIIPFNQRCPGTEGAVEQVGKKAPLNSADLSTGSSQPSSSTNDTNSLLFTSGKEDLIQHRSEDGYDLFDPEYINHPDAVPNSEVFSDVSPVDGSVLTDAHHLLSKNSSSTPSSTPSSRSSTSSTTTTPSSSSSTPSSSSTTPSSSSRLSSGDTNSSSSILAPETLSNSSTPLLQTCQFHVH